MRKLILLIVVLMIAFVIVERHKLFVRDPLANVARDGAKESGAQVFINIDNDVLVENDNQPLYVELIQHGQPVGVPKETGCIHWLVCLMDNYPATLLGTTGGAAVESMDAKTVTFTDSGHRATVVTLR